MRTTWKNSCGSITLVALTLAVVIGISLASYLALCRQSLLLSTRTVNVSKARQLAETGLEEALWSLNNNNWTLGTWTLPVTDLDGDGKLDRKEEWTDLQLGDGATGIITILVSDYLGNTPTITSTVIVTVPGQTFTRSLTATTKSAPLLCNALGITNTNNGRISFSTSGLVDSWDTDYLEYDPSIAAPPTLLIPHRDYNFLTPYIPYPGFCAVTTPATLFPAWTPSLYPPRTPPDNTYPSAAFNYAATIAAPNITLNGAEIRGYVATFGNSVSLTLGAGGSQIEGPPIKGAPAPTPPIVNYARISKSAIVPDFTVAPPGGSYDNYTITSPIMSGTTIPVGTVGASVPTQYFIGSTLHIQGSTAELKVLGPVIIWVDGDLELWAGAKIHVTNTGRLEIFVTGDIWIGGLVTSSAQFLNETNEPKNLALYSTNLSTRNFYYYSKEDFCGVMYSASNNSPITFTSTSPYPARHIYGAILANYNIEFDSGANSQIHYDTALQYLPKGWFKGVTTPFILNQVTEVP